MDKVVKIFAVLAVLILLTMPASAYKVKVASGANHIQVTYGPRDVKDLTSGTKTSGAAYNAACEVMKLAKKNHMVINRNVDSMRREIRVHAYFFYVPILDKHAQPVDLVVSEYNNGWIYSAIDSLTGSAKKKALGIINSID